MYTDTQTSIRRLRWLNQYLGKEEEPELSGEEFLIGDDIELNEERNTKAGMAVISEQNYTSKKSIEKKNAFVKLENDHHHQK